MDSSRVDEYLDRIAADRPHGSTVDGLRRLQGAHLRSVPFENLSLHLGEPIDLDPAALFTKVVTRRRGGFCYELNGLFADLLRALGFRVDLLSARVHGSAGYGPPFDHLALRVQLDRPWLVDVGFGRFAHDPLRLDDPGEQVDPNGTFRIVDADDHIDVSMDGEPQYRLDPRPYDLSDFVPSCWWQATWPGSGFLQGPRCSMMTAAGRVTLAGQRLITTGADGARDERTLDSDQEVLKTYRTVFGLDLERVPRRPAAP
jgi:N-hydroxyarylamine O-acetyltransferase